MWPRTRLPNAGALPMMANGVGAKPSPRPIGAFRCRGFSSIACQCDCFFPVDESDRIALFVQAGRGHSKAALVIQRRPTAMQAARASARIRRAHARRWHKRIGGGCGGTCEYGRDTLSRMCTSDDTQIPPGCIRQRGIWQPGGEHLGWSVDQAPLYGQGHRLDPAGDLELGQDAADKQLDG